nr:hypothetical protein [Ralstonia syzygii]
MSADDFDRHFGSRRQRHEERYRIWIILGCANIKKDLVAARPADISQGHLDEHVVSGFPLSLQIGVVA